MRRSSASIPATQLSVMERAESAIRRIDCNTLKIITGLKTFNSKCPFDPAIVTDTWLPMTWAQTMVMASHWVGLTLPGIMDDPGSFSGRIISPMPHRGPEPRRRMSLAIFIIDVAMVFKTPDTSTIASCAAKASNLFSAVTNGRPVTFATFFAKASAKPFLELMPVPTAVPPCANCIKRGKVALTRSIENSICLAYPENS